MKTVVVLAFAILGPAAVGTSVAADKTTSQRPTFEGAKPVEYRSLSLRTRSALAPEFKARDIPTSELSCGFGAGNGAIKWAIGCSHGTTICWANFDEDGLHDVGCGGCGGKHGTCTPWNN